MVLKRYLGPGGMSVEVHCCESQDIQSVIERIVRAYNLQGCINVQLRKQEDRYYVFEINPKLSSTTGFRHKMGFQDVIWWFMLIDGEKIPNYRSDADGKIGVKLMDDIVLTRTDVRREGRVKVLFLTNNRNTIPLYEWISERCPAEMYSERLTVGYLRQLNPELVVSYNYIYKISQECIDAVHENIINMHISMLPWNRGSNPNIWSFIDNTPKGVTIHMLSAGLDEGDILFQEEVQFDPQIETFETSYTKLNNMITDLFQRNWYIMSSGKYKEIRKKQEGRGSYHTIADLKKLKENIAFDWSDNIYDFLLRYNRCRLEI